MLFILRLILCLFPLSAFAMFCPTSFEQINLGDSMVQVEKTCGKPNETQEEIKPPPVPQEWSYYITTQPGAPSVKMSIAINDNKIINITVNALSLDSIATCQFPIKVGDSVEVLKSACGEPGFISKSQPTHNAPPTKLNEFRYNSTPPVTLFFENDKLVDRK